ncbi:MAG: hypothetical protein ABUL72_03225 [Armatimonadota bacterium]
MNFLFALATQPIDDPLHSLDFWVGDWVVTADGKKDGDDKVEKWVGGQAIVEHWKDVEGGEGKSFSYYMPASSGSRFG